MKILAIGDVVGHTGVAYLRANLRRIKNHLDADLVIVNGENAAEIHGISQSDASDIFLAGADVITTGNHAFGRFDIYSYLDDEKYILRAANFPGSAPGHGYCIINASGMRVLVINLQGNVSMKVALASPFDAADTILKRESGNYDIAVLDFHAEATSEKLAMGYYLDGRASIIFGTHTHVATADAQVLQGGTGYITDLGMCGSMNGILGVKTESIIHKFMVKTPNVFEAAEGNCKINGAYFEIDEKTGKCLAAQRVEGD